MEERLKQWMELKDKLISNKKSNIYFKEGQIWFCHLGLNIGFEQDGKGEEFLRPVLIIKKFNQNVFLGLPLTTNLNKSGKYYMQILCDKKVCNVVLSQVKLLDRSRLKSKITKIDKKLLNQIVCDFKSIL